IFTGRSIQPSQNIAAAATNAPPVNRLEPTGLMESSFLARAGGRYAKVSMIAEGRPASRARAVGAAIKPGRPSPARGPRRFPLREPRFEPLRAGLRPGRTGPAALPDAEVVGGSRVEVKFRGDLGAFESQVEDDAVSGARDEVLAAVRQEDRRRAGRDLETGGQLIPVVRLEVARVDQDG